jgi:UDPglucose 6-dehydrogenase/GDP-mannose 6-dehydrogenase
VKIAIVGTGYVGLVTGACLADRGHQVVCADADPDKVRLLKQGTSPFYERGLDSLLRRHLGRRLSVTLDVESAAAGSDVTFICVGTPLNGDEIDLSAVREAAARVGRGLARDSAYQAVIVKSTVVPGTTEDVVGPILERESGRRAGQDFGLGANPEFLTEGQAVDDFLHPDRLVLGGIDRRTIATLEAVYRSFTGIPVLRTNPRTAETIKYASNAFLATCISFANEVASLCAAIGDVDIVEVMQGLHASRYLTLETGPQARAVAPITTFLWAGCGFGGSCLPKDVRALTTHGRRLGVPMPLLDAVLDVNARQPARLLDLLRKHYPSLAGVRVAVLGLAFRPDTDDIRESPALPLIRTLLAEGAQVTAYDPVAMPNAARDLAGQPVTFADDLATALRAADAVLIVTRWSEFAQVPSLLRHLHPQPLVVDGRRMIDPRSVSRYEGIGR